MKFGQLQTTRNLAVSTCCMNVGFCMSVGLCVVCVWTCMHDCLLRVNACERMCMYACVLVLLLECIFASMCAWARGYVGGCVCGWVAWLWTSTSYLHEQSLDQTTAHRAVATGAGPLQRWNQSVSQCRISRSSSGVCDSTFAFDTSSRDTWRQVARATLIGMHTLFFSSNREIGFILITQWITVIAVWSVDCR